jgi:hypothetical protein
MNLKREAVLYDNKIREAIAKNPCLQGCPGMVEVIKMMNSIRSRIFGFDFDYRPQTGFIDSLYVIQHPVYRFFTSDSDCNKGLKIATERAYRIQFVISFYAGKKSAIIPPRHRMKMRSDGIVLEVQFFKKNEEHSFYEFYIRTDPKSGIPLHWVINFLKK